MKILAIILICIGITVFIFTFYRNSSYNGTTRTFSEYTILTSSWEKYKQDFLNPDGRILDHTQNDITTSEGQSYALLRAVWIDDKTTFDKVWLWTKNNMKLKDRNLFGWRWGAKGDGTYGFMTSNDQNTASDADSDIALALVLAGRRWKDNNYTNQAQAIIQDIWKYDTDTVQNNRFLIGGNWASGNDDVVINPSYFAPYAWRLFASVDNKNDWNSLINPAYKLLTDVGNADLDGKGVGLPPDWVTISKKDGSLHKSNVTSSSSNYSYDAMRVPWRIALDYEWNHDNNAKKYLETLSFLDKDYTTKKIISSSYKHNGEAVNSNENAAMYSTSLGYFIVNDPKNATKIYQDKIINLYSNAEDTFNKSLPYYEQNWLWFGTALYNHYLLPFSS